ncbi:MAG: DUF547 domain-containing protein [Deltaproteobacteria bacterium]|nr:DUF547 domain-containing protein [Deltaproteobacteria bacterium]
MKIKTFIIVALSYFLCFNFSYLIWQARADTVVDHSIYSGLLKKYVHQSRIDYRGFKTQEAHLDQYLKILEGVDPKSLSRNEQFSFYINAYNAWTIKLILSGYPGIKSIKELGSIIKSPWEKKICRIDGNIITLDDMEHKILRPRFKDPRVHFAINCAALSCPPLGDRPYMGSTLDRQLDDSTQRFINNPERNYLKENSLYASKIFKWFRGDFNDDVIGFFLKYADEDLKKELAAKKGRIKIKYLHYDWSLNATTD